MFPYKWIPIAAAILCSPCWYGLASACPAAPFRPSASPGATFTTQCSSVHPSLNPRGVITWQCLTNNTWEGDWSGCTFPEGVSHAVAPLAYRLAASVTEVQSNILTIILAVHGLLQSASSTFGDIHVAYIGPGNSSEETMLVVTLHEEEFFDQSSFQKIQSMSTRMNFTLGGLLAYPVWVGGPTLRDSVLCSCPILWSSLEPEVQLGTGQPLVNLCTAPDYIEATCNCRDLSNSMTCNCSDCFITLNLPDRGRVCQPGTDRGCISNDQEAQQGDQCEACCLEEFSNAYMWPRTLHGVTIQAPCSFSHSRLGSSVLRTCQPNGQWSSVDVSKCVLMDGALGAIVILADVNQPNADLTMQDIDGLLQQLNNSLADYSVSGLSLRAAHATAGSNTTLVIEGDVPLTTAATILSEFQMTNSLGSVSFLHPPSVYGFQPVDECVCSPERVTADSGNWIRICSNTSNTACDCLGQSDCQCLDPFVSVNANLLLKCSLDSDGDGIPDHNDAEPSTYNSSQMSREENCSATVQEPCPADTTSSPSISWSETAPCMRDVQRCSQLLNETVGLAYRLCNSSGQWEEPDMRECQSVTFRNIETTVNNLLMAVLGTTIVAEGGTLELPSNHMELVVNTTQILLDATADILLPMDLNAMVVSLHAIARIAENTNIVNASEFNEITTFSIVDNILMSKNDQVWKAAGRESDSVSIMLLNATEKLTSAVANNLKPGDVFAFFSTNIAIKARSFKMDSSRTDAIQFDGGNTVSASVSIPDSVVGGAGSAVVSFLNRLPNFLPRVYANQSSLEDDISIPSAIISVQVQGVEGFTDALAMSPINMHFEGIHGTPVCASWDHATMSNGIGGWTMDGLTTHHHALSTTVNCSSRHLTSFSVLVHETVGLTYNVCNGSGPEESAVKECHSMNIMNVQTNVNDLLMNILNTTVVAEGGTLVLPPRQVESLVNTTQVLLDATEDSLERMDLNATVASLHSLARIAEITNLVNASEFNENTTFSIVDNILMSRNDEVWKAAGREFDSTAATLLNATEKLTSAVANNLKPGGEFTFNSTNIVIEARSFKIDSSRTDAIQFDGGKTVSENVSIPGNVVGEAGSAVVSFLNRLPNFLPRVHANQTMLEDSINISSGIVSIQVEGMEGYTVALNMSPISIQFEGMHGTPLCVFWNYTNQENSAMSSFGAGGWSMDGLTTDYNDVSMTVNCTSRHLTSFAVLVNVAGTKFIYKTPSSLYFISYIGCGISLLCLIVTIVFLLVTMRQLKREKKHKAMLSNFVLINFCTALAWGLLVFMAGVEGAKSVDVGCKIVAFLLHYFFLAAFFWMLCEAVMMYNLIVKVFRTNERKWACLYFVIGWVAPLPIAIISVLLRHQQYVVQSNFKNETIACWLSTDNGTIYAFIIPMLLVLLVNAVLLAYVMRSLFKFFRASRRRQFKANKAVNEAMFLTWKLFKSFIIILPLFGFTWIIGLFAINEETLVFAWLFVIFNSLQGTAIFFFYVVRNDLVWGRIVSLFKRCFSRVRKPQTTSTATPGHSPPQNVTKGMKLDSDSERNNWTLSVVKPDTTTNLSVTSQHESQLLSPASPGRASNAVLDASADSFANPDAMMW